MSYAVNPTGQNFAGDTDANFRQNPDFLSPGHATRAVVVAKPTALGLGFPARRLLLETLDPSSVPETWHGC